jgi:hypothetical protein
MDFEVQILKSQGLGSRVQVLGFSLGFQKAQHPGTNYQGLVRMYEYPLALRATRKEHARNTQGTRKTCVLISLGQYPLAMSFKNFLLYIMCVCVCLYVCVCVCVCVCACVRALYTHILISQSQYSRALTF